MPFSVRLDAATQVKIRRLSVATGRSKSDVMREAVSQYMNEGVPAPGGSAYDRLRPYLGVVASGDAHASIETHAKYRALLRRKHRAKGSR